MVATVQFESFNRLANGRIITEGGGYAFIQSRNQHGSHHLVVVDMGTWQAIKHGTAASLLFAFNFCGQHAYRKVARVAARAGIQWTFHYQE